MDRLDLSILDEMLNTLTAVSQITAVSHKTILAKVNTSPSHLYRKLSALTDKGYVAKGIKDGLESNYYITEHGKKALAEVFE